MWSSNSSLSLPPPGEGQDFTDIFPWPSGFHKLFSVTPGISHNFWQSEVKPPGGGRTTTNLNPTLYFEYISAYVSFNFLVYQPPSGQGPGYPGLHPEVPAGPGTSPHCIYPRDITDTVLTRWNGHRWRPNVIIMRLCLHFCQNSLIIHITN